MRTSGPSRTTLGAKPAISCAACRKAYSRTTPKPWRRSGGASPKVRIHTGVEHRVFYIAKFAEAIYVLHAFEKRSQQTRKADLDLGRQRLAEVVRFRREQEDIL